MINFKVMNLLDKVWLSEFFLLSVIRKVFEGFDNTKEVSKLCSLIKRETEKNLARIRNYTGENFKVLCRKNQLHVLSDKISFLFLFPEHQGKENTGYISELIKNKNTSRFENIYIISIQNKGKRRSERKKSRDKFILKEHFSNKNFVMEIYKYWSVEFFIVNILRVYIKKGGSAFIFGSKAKSEEKGNDWDIAVSSCDNFNLCYLDLSEIATVDLIEKEKMPESLKRMSEGKWRRII